MLRIEENFQDASFLNHKLKIISCPRTSTYDKELLTFVQNFAFNKDRLAQFVDALDKTF